MQYIVSVKAAPSRDRRRCLLDKSFISMLVIEYINKMLRGILKKKTSCEKKRALRNHGQALEIA